MQKATFQGFDKKAVAFFKNLSKNNNKEWFDAHRADYDAFVMEASKDFVVAIGEKLFSIAPDISAIPKVNKSLFRINKDVRFSKDKSPYKTHMGLWLWEGNLKRMENSGFYFHLEPDFMMIGTGIYMFPPNLMETYRKSVDHPIHGPALEKAIAKVQKAGYKVGGEQYKRVPRGFDADHPRAELLKYKGLWAGFDEPIPDVFYTKDLPSYCFKHYKAMLPVHTWLKEMTERV